MSDLSYNKKGLIDGYRFGGVYKFEPDPKIDNNTSQEGIIIAGQFCRKNIELIVRTNKGTLLKVDEYGVITVLQELR